MPGPRNSKRQKKLKALKGKKRKGTPECRAEDEPVATTAVDGDATPADPAPRAEEEEEEGLLREPPIYDPGTGPRVRSMDEFLRSSFASEPTWDDELCAEFAQEEMLEMLRTVLPQEMALCVWYNKSRRCSRVCPACWRVFQTGDVLPSPLEGLALPRVPHKVYPELVGEQRISGLCSTVCFVVASSNYPEAVRLIFGRSAGEMEEITWEYLNMAGGGGRDDGGLSMMLRMTRLDDLGLGQLLFP